MHESDLTDTACCLKVWLEDNRVLLVTELGQQDYLVPIWSLTSSEKLLMTLQCETGIAFALKEFCFIFLKKHVRRKWLLWSAYHYWKKKKNLKTKTKIRDTFLFLGILLEPNKEMMSQLRPVKEKNRELLLQKCQFPQMFPHFRKKKERERESLNNCSTDKYAKNNTELNNPALTPCEKTRSAFQREAFSFARIMRYILQETNDS